MTDLQAYRALPALRTSLKWYKRELVRRLSRLAADHSGRPLAVAYSAKVRKVCATKPALLRAHYLAERTSEIRSAPLWHLRQVLPALVRVSA